MSTQSYQHWRGAALAGTYTPLSAERLAEMYAYTCRYGSGNGWHGTSGTMAGYVRELLREVEWLREHTTNGVEHDHGDSDHG